MTDRIRIYGLVPDSIVDGPGLRYSIFVQGCAHNCKGCHNPESQPFDGGTMMEIGDICEDILGNKLISGVTFSGGEPFDQPEACAKIAEHLKAGGKDIWAYTGYLFEDLLARTARLGRSESDSGNSILEFLKNIDVLVDGPFVDSLHSYDLKWRGSSNQRLIDVPKTLKEGRVVEWSQPIFTLDIPPNW